MKGRIFFYIVLYALVVLTSLVVISCSHSKKHEKDGLSEIVEDTNEANRTKQEEYLGFIKDDGVEIVAANCSGCHSSKLVTQNRATREGWKSMITWMQETQNLWDLGANEGIILDYLAKNYPPSTSGRRIPLTEIEWYLLEE